jgi:hypothetical protein
MLGDVPASNLDALELFFGEATDAEARVYARLPWNGPLDRWRVTGTLTGPECRYAKTLPATFEFHDLGPGEGLLAEAIVTEPCFWTPELPFLYRCTVELRGAGDAAEGPEVYSSRSVVMTPHEEDGSYSVASSRRSVSSTLVERLIGIRRLGAVGCSLYLDGKRWVARGVCLDDSPLTTHHSPILAAARESSAVLRVPSPDDAFCLEASRLGVPLFVDLSVDAAQLLPKIRRLGRWPAVFAIILDHSVPIGPEHRAAARNSLFAVPLPGGVSMELEARRVSEGSATGNRAAPPRLRVGLPAWAQLAICPVESSETFAEAVRDCPLPILAVRQSAANLSIPEARAACDRLQFDLSPIGQFAGYIV